MKREHKPKPKPRKKKEQLAQDMPSARTKRALELERELAEAKDDVMEALNRYYRER